MSDSGVSIDRGTSRAPLARRIAVVVGALLALLVLHHTPLVGVNTAPFEEFGESLQSCSLLALADSSVIQILIVVELAARVVPRFRPLRLGPLPSRDRLRRAAAYLLIPYAGLHAFLVALSLRHFDGEFGIVDERLGALAVPFLTLQLLAATSFLWVLASFVDRFGVGSGFSWIVGYFVVNDWVSGFPWNSGTSASVVFPMETTTYVAGGLVGTTLLGWFVARDADRRDGSEGTGGPALAGVVPLDLTLYVLALFVLVKTGGGETLYSSIGLATYANARLSLDVAIIVLSTPLFASEFARTKGGAEPGAPISAVAIGRSIAWALGLAAISSFVMRSTGLSLDLVPTVVFPAFVLDVYGELRAIRAHGPLVCVSIPSTMPDVAHAKDLLAAEGIDVVVRCERQRRFYHLFGPAYETQVMVAATDVEKATETLAAHGMA